MLPPRRLPALLLASLAGATCAMAARPPAPPAPTPPAAPSAPAAPGATPALACALLTAEDVRAVQGSAVVESKGSGTETAGGNTSRCFLRTAEFARSVSVEVVLPQRTRSPRLGGVRAISPRERWQTMFHRAVEAHGDAEREEREQGEGGETKPLAVAHLGEEAFWIGTGMTGAIYVLQGDAYLRLSAGGPGDSAARLRRSRDLAQRALPRLRHALGER